MKLFDRSYYQSDEVVQFFQISLLKQPVSQLNQYQVFYKHQETLPDVLLPRLQNDPYLKQTPLPLAWLPLYAGQVSSDDVEKWFE